MPELDWSPPAGDMPIHRAIKNDWTTPETLIEGSVNCAKTTVWLDKEIDAVFKYPGIRSLLFRWSQDAVETKLRPAFEEVMKIRGTDFHWEDKPKRYVFEGDSMAYMFGLKTVSMIELMSKIRGLGVSRLGGDQVEEIDPAVGGELRGRLRPDLTTTVMKKISYPFQLTFVSNSEDDDFWLSKEFPVDNHIKGRRVHQISVFDNKHLPQESIDSLLRQYPEDHPLHRTMVLGRRGPRIFGMPVFEKGLYRKDLHWRPISIQPNAPILESFEFGKQNPAFVFGQQTPTGGLVILGAILALETIMEDFVQIVKQFRQRWYPPNAVVRSCVSPMSDRASFNGLNVFREQSGITARYDSSGNSPDVRLAMVERISRHLRRRDNRGVEEFGISNDETRFLIVSRDGERYAPIVHFSFEGGFTWDKHFVSTGNKELKQPFEDDKYANLMHCIENIELNFCAGQKTPQEVEDDRKRRDALARPRSSHSPNSWMGV